MNKVAKKPNGNFKHDVQLFEKEFEKLGGVRGKEMDKLCPVMHEFVPGAYIRKIFMPAGTLLTSKIHKTRHPYFVMTGHCTVATENGTEEIVAPKHGITEPGTKRVLYIHQDTVWITVHPTDETDLEKIEDQIIAKSFDEALPADNKEELT